MIIAIKLKNFFSIKEEIIIDFTAETPRKSEEGLSANLLEFKKDKFLNIIGLFGSNAAGKSNVIKAIKFCRDLILGSHLYNEGVKFDYEPFKFGSEKPSEFTINFITDGIEYEYSFSLNKEKILAESLFYYPKNRKAKIFTRTNTDSYSFGKGLIQRPAEVEVSTGPQTLFLSRGSSLNRNILKPVYLFFLNGIKFGLEDLEVNHGLKKDIEENRDLLLKAMEISDSDISDIRITETDAGDVRILTYHKENPLLPFDFDKEESEGTKRLLLILLLLIKSSKSDTTIFFDEFDLKLHLRLAEFVLDVVRESKSSQLMFTSHNPYLINPELLRYEQIVIVSKLNDGSSELIPLSDYKGINKIKDLGRAYLQGRFDGVPYTGNVSYIFEE